MCARKWSPRPSLHVLSQPALGKVMTEVKAYLEASNLSSTKKARNPRRTLKFLLKCKLFYCGLVQAEAVTEDQVVQASVLGL